MPKGDAHKSKKGVKSASSSEAAALVFRQGGFSGGFSAGFGGIGGSNASRAATSGIELDQDISPEVRVVFRNLSKRDTTTKIRALSELRSFCENSSAAQVEPLLRHWMSSYEWLSDDHTRQVREECNVLMGLIAGHVGRKMAPYLKDVLPLWLACRFDTSREVRAIAERTFTSTFPAQKEADTILFAWKEITSFIGYNLKQTAQTLSNEQTPSDIERLDRYDRVVSSSLGLLAHLINTVPLRTVGKVDTVKSVLKLCSVSWTFCGSKSSLIRRSAYVLVKSFASRFILGENGGNESPLTPLPADYPLSKVSPLVFASIGDADTSNHLAMWEAILIYSRTFPQAFGHIDVNKAFYPRLFDLVRRRGHDLIGLKHLSQGMLPLLSFLPDDLVNGSGSSVVPKFVSAVLDALRDDPSVSGSSKGVGAARVQSSTAAILLGVLGETLALLSQRAASKSRGESNQYTAGVLRILDAVLDGCSWTPDIRHFALRARLFSPDQTLYPGVWDAMQARILHTLGAMLDNDAQFRVKDLAPPLDCIRVSELIFGLSSTQQSEEVNTKVVWPACSVPMLNAIFQVALDGMCTTMTEPSALSSSYGDVLQAVASAGGLRTVLQGLGTETAADFFRSYLLDKLMDMLKEVGSSLDSTLTPNVVKDLNILFTLLGQAIEIEAPTPNGGKIALIVDSVIELIFGGHFKHASVKWKVLSMLVDTVVAVRHFPQPLPHLDLLVLETVREGQILYDTPVAETVLSTVLSAHDSDSKSLLEGATIQEALTIFTSSIRLGTDVSTEVLTIHTRLAGHVISSLPEGDPGAQDVIPLLIASQLSGRGIGTEARQWWEALGSHEDTMVKQASEVSSKIIQMTIPLLLAYVRGDQESVTNDLSVIAKTHKILRETLGARDATETLITAVVKEALLWTSRSHDPMDSGLCCRQWCLDRNSGCARPALDIRPTDHSLLRRAIDLVNTLYMTPVTEFLLCDIIVICAHVEGSTETEPLVIDVAQSLGSSFASERMPKALVERALTRLFSEGSDPSTMAQLGQFLNRVARASSDSTVIAEKIFTICALPQLSQRPSVHLVHVVESISPLLLAKKPVMDYGSIGPVVQPLLDVLNEDDCDQLGEDVRTTIAEGLDDTVSEGSLTNRVSTIADALAILAILIEASTLPDSMGPEIRDIISNTQSLGPILSAHASCAPTLHSALIHTLGPYLSFLASCVSRFAPRLSSWRWRIICGRAIESLKFSSLALENGQLFGSTCKHSETSMRLFARVAIIDPLLLTATTSAQAEDGVPIGVMSLDHDTNDEDDDAQDIPEILQACQGEGYQVLFKLFCALPRSLPTSAMSSSEISPMTPCQSRTSTLPYQELCTTSLAATRLIPLSVLRTRRAPTKQLVSFFSGGAVELQIAAAVMLGRLASSDGILASLEKLVCVDEEGDRQDIDGERADELVQQSFPAAILANASLANDSLLHGSPGAESTADRLLSGDGCLRPAAVQFFTSWYVILQYARVDQFQKARGVLSLCLRHSRLSTLFLSSCCYYLQLGHIPSDIDFAAFELSDLVRTDPRSVTCFMLALFRDALTYQPVVVRTWWSDTCDRATSEFVDRLCTEHVSSLIVARTLQQITASDRLREVRDFSVSVRRNRREVVCMYTKDEALIELEILLPQSYPLRDVSLEWKNRKGVSDLDARRWLLSMKTLLSVRDGSLLDAVLMWKENIDRRFEGLEDCPICYSVVHVGNGTIPTMQCKTCKHKFHSVCLYKWFKTSAKSTCPLCTNPF